MAKNKDYGLNQRKNGVYEKSEYINGKREYFYSKDPDEVMRKYYARLEGVERGLTFDEAADAYENEHFSEIEAGSERTYSPALKRARGRFGADPIKDITPADVKAWVAWLGRRYAYKTVKNNLSVVRQVFDFAIVEKGAAIHNPCERIKVPDTLSRSTREPLTEEQLAKVKATTKEDFILAFLVLYTGTRCGEALALQKQDFNGKTDEVTISKAVHFKGNRPYIGRLKTKKSARVIPYLAPLKDMIGSLNLADEDYIIGGKEGPITQCALKRRWGAYCLAHGMAQTRKREINKVNKSTGEKIMRTEIVPDIDRHQIRHEFATMCFDAGLDPKDVQEILGHADYSTTMDIYVHWKNNRLLEAKVRLNTYLAKSGA